MQLAPRIPLALIVKCTTQLHESPTLDHLRHGHQISVYAVLWGADKQKAKLIFLPGNAK